MGSTTAVTILVKLSDMYLASAMILACFDKSGLNE